MSVAVSVQRRLKLDSGSGLQLLKVRVKFLRFSSGGSAKQTGHGARLGKGSPPSDSCLYVEMLTRLKIIASPLRPTENQSVEGRQAEYIFFVRAVI